MELSEDSARKILKSTVDKLNQRKFRNAVKCGDCCQKNTGQKKDRKRWD